MKFEIYGKENCIYCTRSKQTLDDKNFQYDYWDVEKDPAKHAEMKSRNPTYRTLPHIYVDGQFLEGFDGLRAFLKKRG